MQALHSNNYTRILQEILYDYDVDLSNSAYGRINTYMNKNFVIPFVTNYKKYAAEESIPVFECITAIIDTICASYSPEIQNICTLRCANSVQMLLMASRSSAPLRERVQSLVSLDAVHGILENTIGYKLAFEDDIKVYIGTAFETLAHICIAQMIHIELEYTCYGLIKKTYEEEQT